MTYTMCRIALSIVLVSFGLSSAWAATCSNASLSGTYGFLHDGTDSNGAPFTAAVTQITFDSTTGVFAGETVASHDGVIAISALAGTYTIAPDCTGTGTPTGGSPFTIVVTSTGFLALHLFSEGFAVKQGSPSCTNAGLAGNFGFQATGASLAESAAPATAFIGELNLTVNSSGGGVISGHLSASENGTFLTFADLPVTGFYTIDRNCRGIAVITPKGQPRMHFRLVVVDGGNEMLAVESDAGTIVSGALQR